MTSIFDWGEVIRIDNDDTEASVLGVVVRSEGAAIRFRALAMRTDDDEEDLWNLPEVPTLGQDNLITLNDTHLTVTLVPETDAVRICAGTLRQADIPTFRAWWSGKAVGRR